jgi:hypothetical protein
MTRICNVFRRAGKRDSRCVVAVVSAIGRNTTEDSIFLGNTCFPRHVSHTLGLVWPIL